MIRSGRRIDHIEFTLTTGDQFIHGGTGGGYGEAFLLDNDEHLTKVEYDFCKKDGTLRVCWIKFTTSKGRSLERGNRSNNVRASVEAPEGYQIVGMYGRSGDEIDYLGFYMFPLFESRQIPILTKTIAHGESKEGNNFSDDDVLHRLLTNEDEFSVEKIVLRSGRRIDRIEFTLTTGDRFIHGGSGGGYSNPLALDNTEYLTKVEYDFCKKDGTSRVCWIKFTTSKGRSLERGNRSSFYRAIVEAPQGHQIVGMYGRSGDEIDYLGFYVLPLPTTSGIALQGVATRGDSHYGKVTVNLDYDLSWNP